LKLNLGCGKDLKDGWVNVDIYGENVVRHDLNVKPWPWENDSADEVCLHHVLEHLPDTIGVMKELYRICKKDAVVHIAVPHPFHNDFISDPTHVTPIMPGTLHSFSKKANLATINDANSPLGLINDVDFEVTKEALVVEQRWMQRMEDGLISEEQLRDAILTFNNVVKQIEMTLRVVK
jgi:hypothetical protein